MAYGVKRGFKAPGEFGVSDIFGLGLAGAAGIIAALVTDFQQQGESSALFTINQWVIQAGSILGFTDIPLWMVVAGLTLAGAMSIFYFQPITRQGAFAQGFGMLAVLMTATPPDLAGGIESITDKLPGLEAAVMREASAEPRLINAVYAPAVMQAQPIQQRHDANKYDVHLKIIFPDGIPRDIDTMIRQGTLRGRLHNEDTNETWNIFRSAGGTMRREGNAIFIHAGVPARSDRARLWVRIECMRYTIEEQSAVATLGQTLEWTIELRRSRTPLFIQRLGKSYWF